MASKRCYGRPHVLSLPLKLDRMRRRTAACRRSLCSKLLWRRTLRRRCHVVCGSVAGEKYSRGGGKGQVVPTPRRCLMNPSDDFEARIRGGNMKASQLALSRASVLAAKMAMLVCIVSFSMFVQRAFPRKYLFS
jgi:hypothetical protein